jgi:hypothetical protein
MDAICQCSTLACLNGVHIDFLFETLKAARIRWHTLFCAVFHIRSRQSKVYAGPRLVRWLIDGRWDYLALCVGCKSSKVVLFSHPRLSQVLKHGRDITPKSPCQKNPLTASRCATCPRKSALGAMAHGQGMQSRSCWCFQMLCACGSSCRQAQARRHLLGI